MSPRHAQSGVSMIESLVAILVLAIGVMGLAGLQARSLVETRLTNARADALMLANDLAERMRLNRGAALLNTYNRRFDDAIPNQVDCLSRACDAAQLTAFDTNEWLTQVGRLLPSGQARIDAPTPSGQIRVTFRWRNNVRGAEFGATADQANLMGPMTVPIDGCQSAGDQRDWICHQVFIRR